MILKFLIYCILSLLSVLSFSQEKSIINAQIGIIFNHDRDDTSGFAAITLSIENVAGKDIYIPDVYNVLYSKTGKMLSLYKDGVLYRELDSKYYSGKPFARVEPPD